MTTGEIASVLWDYANTHAVDEAASVVPRAPGLYAIHVVDAGLLPDPFGRLLATSGRKLLYVGAASQSLYERLIEQELRHKRAATFFRGLGAVLGYRPPAGSLIGKANKNNYRFSMADTEQTVAWMRQNLRVKWVEVPAAELPSIEPSVISSLCPLLNTMHNPSCCPELAELRSKCRNIACSG